MAVPRMLAGPLVPKPIERLTDPGVDDLLLVPAQEFIGVFADEAVFHVAVAVGLPEEILQPGPKPEWQVMDGVARTLGFPEAEAPTITHVAASIGLALAQSLALLPPFPPDFPRPFRISEAHLPFAQVHAE